MLVAGAFTHDMNKGVIFEPAWTVVQVVFILWYIWTVTEPSCVVRNECMTHSKTEGGRCGRSKGCRVASISFTAAVQRGV